MKNLFKYFLILIVIIIAVFALVYLYNMFSEVDTGQDIKVPEIYLDENTKISSKTSGKYFEVYNGQSWETYYIKGTNIGTSIPGRWFTEFLADRDVYRRWLEDIGEMNLNTIRLYTLFDPAFYQVLKEYNEDPTTPTLRLIQEIWPDDFVPGCNFHDSVYKTNYKQEVEKVIDAMHGNLEETGRPHRAYGNYSADVSPYLLGVLIGREFEPEEVENTNSKNKEYTSYEGNYVAIKEGTPTEVWLAELCDFAISYSNSKYNWQYPVGFVSWPTLDPLTHPTERESEEISAIPAYNDREVINPDRFEIGQSNKTGFFGAYHIYPNYPDFMNNEPGFADSSDEHGTFRYLGYLKDFIDIHPNYPAVVAEYGISTSLNTAHLNPDGLHHGGISEEDQGPQIIRMTNAILEQGYSGSIIFEWLDEWAKKTWNTEPYLSPWERNVLWKNAMDPEQNYGIISVEPDHIPYSGDSYNKTDYSSTNQMGQILSFEKDADEAFLYLGLTFSDLPKDNLGAIDWDEINLVIGIDTVEREKGEHQLPVKDSPQTPTGVEFVIEINSSEDAKIKVIPEYNRAKYSYYSDDSYDGIFEEMEAVVNRERITLDGRRFPALSSNQSILNYGNFYPSSEEYSSLAHWYIQEESNVLKIRLPWMLIGVTDPSSGMVAYDEREFLKDPDSANYVTAFERCSDEMPAYSLEAAEDIEDWKRLSTKQTEGFLFYMATFNEELIDYQPRDNQTFYIEEVYLWELWEEPSYAYRYKESYGLLKEYFGNVEFKINEEN